MDFANNEALEVLKFLLPGLIASWAFRAVSPHNKPEGLAALIEALLFTAVAVLVLGLAHWLGEKNGVVGAWSASSNYVVSLVIGLLLGGLAGLASNKDWLHIALRWLKITKNTASPSEWYRAFYGTERHVILHLWDGRRVQGWPAEYPNTPGAGHFLMQEAQWLPDEGDPIQLANAAALLIPAEQVLYVEFLKSAEEADNDEQAKPVEP
jgi:hypothetical protein